MPHFKEHDAGDFDGLPSQPGWLKEGDLGGICEDCDGDGTINGHLCKSCGGKGRK